MAVQGIKITPFVERETERIDPAKGRCRYPAAVLPESERIARGPRNGIPIGSCNGGGIGIAVACMDPAVETADQVIYHSVGVDIFKGSYQFFLLIGYSVSIGIGKPVNMGNAVSDRAPMNRRQTDRNIQLRGKGNEFIGFSVSIAIFQDRDPVATLSRWSGHGVFSSVGDPQPPCRVELHVNGLVDIRF